jgi:hypothetical protein
VLKCCICVRVGVYTGRDCIITTCFRVTIYDDGHNSSGNDFGESRTRVKTTSQSMCFAILLPCANG